MYRFERKRERERHGSVVPLGLYPCWSLHLECLAGHTRLLFALGSPSPWPGLSTTTNPFLFLKK